MYIRYNTQFAFVFINCGKALKVQKGEFLLSLFRLELIGKINILFYKGRSLFNCVHIFKDKIGGIFLKIFYGAHKVRDQLTRNIQENRVEFYFFKALEIYIYMKLAF